MKLALLGLTLFLALGGSLAQGRGTYCRAGEYPRGVSVRNGKISLVCAKVECSRPIYPKCNKVFYEMACKQNQWVGAIADDSELGGLVPLQCCDVPELRASRHLGTRDLTDGSDIIGQQLRDNRGHLAAFDIVTNIKNNNGVLRVEAARLRCKRKGAEPVQFQLHGGGVPLGTFGNPERLEEEYAQDYGQQGDQQLQGDQYGEQDAQAGQEGYADEVIYVEQPAQELPAPQYPEPGLFPQPAPPAAPFAGPLAAGGAAGGICFTPDTTVETPSGIKTMEELKIGDQVLTVEEGIQRFATVTSFIHRLPDIDAEYHEIKGVDGTSLKVSQEHFLFIAKCKAIKKKPELKFAKDVKPGDCWVKVDSTKQRQSFVRVASNTIVRQTGAYAPLTENGVIVTNGVLASCYAVYKDETFMHYFFHYTNMLKDMFSGVFDFAASHLPEGVTELPWLVSYGQSHMDNLIAKK